MTIHLNAILTCVQVAIITFAFYDMWKMRKQRKRSEYWKSLCIREQEMADRAYKDGDHEKARQHSAACNEYLIEWKKALGI